MTSVLPKITETTLIKNTADEGIYKHHQQINLGEPNITISKKCLYIMV